MTLERRDIVIVGSGFAGSILARILAHQGRDVVLVERGRHPRFALGESSTPLASLSLERLAARYGLEDLHHLSTYGRWLRHLPQLRRGLKRGFTFYRHSPGRPYANDPTNSRRLLVAASPDDEIADVHWMRSDVDAFLVERAVEAGVDFRSQTLLTELQELPEGVLVGGEGPGGKVGLKARFLVDASGGYGFVARALAKVQMSAQETRTPRPHAPASAQLIFGHFEGVSEFVDRAREGGASMIPGPYPDSRAAVHHLLDEGWLYALPFDHGVVSAGLIRRGAGPPLPTEPRRAWEAVLERYPTLETCFGSARPLQPIARVSSFPYRRAKVVGDRWLLLPHAFAFFDPLFSTGIAWSLMAVERVAQMFERGGESSSLKSDLGRYQDLLEREASQISDLIEGAYLAMAGFDRFTSFARLYFAAASFQELSQRLLAPPTQGWAWQGFLGATDPVSRSFFREGRIQLAAGEDSPEAWKEWVDGAIEPRNVIGLCDPRRRNLYPVDVDVLLDNSDLLGLSRVELERRLPRLRGC